MKRSTPTDEAREALYALLGTKPLNTVVAFEAAVRAEYKSFERTYHDGYAEGVAAAEAKLAALREAALAVCGDDLRPDFEDGQDIVLRSSAGVAARARSRSQSALLPVQGRDVSHRYDHDGEHQWWLCLPPCPVPTAPTPREVLLSDAEKLRVLATWFDHFDDWREATGKIAPGITDYREVQEDLRRIAAALTPREPLDVERLALALDEWRPMLKAWLKPKGVQPSTRQTAETIAAEYARLEAER